MKRTSPLLWLFVLLLMLPLSAAGERAGMHAALIAQTAQTAQAEKEETPESATLNSIPNVRLTDARQHVSDPDGIIGEPSISQINQTLNTLEDSTGCQVAVVAVYSIEDVDPHEFANALFAKWGIGGKNADNGLLILLVTKKNERSITFETGYGIEGILPDAICKRIQTQHMVPLMSEGKFGEGMAKGVEATAAVLYGYDGNRDDDDSLTSFLPCLYFALFFFGAIALICYFQTYKKCPKCKKRKMKRTKRTMLLEATRRKGGLACETWTCSHCGYTETKNVKTPRISSGGGIVGGGGGGFIGGGGGGFSGGGGSWGGGSSGGGGASTRF